MASFDLDNYETVQDRIIRFYKAFPNGRIYTDRIYGDERRFEIKAFLYRNFDDLEPMATGHAEEIVGVGMVNKTSALENCETSAIGRAISNSVLALSAPLEAKPSAEEMKKVERYKESPRKPIASIKPSAEQIAHITKLYADIPTIQDKDALRSIFTAETKILDLPVNGTTLRDALTAKAESLK
jgi:hypothetical protein